MVHPAVCAKSQASTQPAINRFASRAPERLSQRSTGRPASGAMAITTARLGWRVCVVKPVARPMWMTSLETATKRKRSACRVSPGREDWPAANADRASTISTTTPPATRALYASRAHPAVGVPEVQLEWRSFSQAGGGGSTRRGRARSPSTRALRTTVHLRATRRPVRAATRPVVARLGGADSCARGAHPAT